MIYNIKKENDNNSSENVKQEENTEIEIKITSSTQEENKIPDEEKKEIIEETGKQGDSDLYEIQEGQDNIKIATIKSSVKYKVAFAGIIKNGQPNKNDLDEIMQENHPQKAGIWIYDKDR